MPETVSLAIEDQIAQVTLNRPDKKNAMSLQMMEELVTVAEGLRTDKSVRVVILNAEGDSFCAGLDLADLMGLAGNLDKTREMLATVLDKTGANIFQRPCTIWKDFPQPVIAVVKGNTLGAGAQLALGADYRIAAPDTRFSIMEAKWGLIPDMGITQSLPGIMRADQAFEIISTGRILDAREAQEFGLLSKVEDDADEAAHSYAETLRLSSPDALAALKTMTQSMWSAGKAGLELEAALQSSLIGTPNQMEKSMASMQKRVPSFT